MAVIGAKRERTNVGRCGG